LDLREDIGRKAHPTPSPRPNPARCESHAGPFRQEHNGGVQSRVDPLSLSTVVRDFVL